ncbi:Grixazone synthase [Cladorrhinum sp. PSN332]|nr:Grixazone synthase [Cladorrhinum sp. PSN332]
MKMLTSSILLVAVVAAPALSLHPPAFSQSVIDSGSALKTLNSLALLEAHTKFGPGCNPLKLKIRQEWRRISKPRRRKFIAAVKCIQAKPSILPPNQVPASMTLYDDLAWAHALRTGLVHNSGWFLPFHRYYIYAYEKALGECGWDAGLPYWEWALDVNGPHLSPLFDGSDTSLGSDGVFISNRTASVLQPPGFNSTTIINPGTGGGCIREGPFSDLVIRLGPYAFNGSFAPLPDSQQAANPRCVTRDLNAQPIQMWNTFRAVTRQILDYDNIQDFAGNLDGDSRVANEPGRVHGGGHIGIGGTARDVRLSPYEPAFWLHHANVDRVWWVWQHLDFETRRGVWATRTWFNIPPTDNATVEDYLEIEPHAPPRKIRELMNSVGGSPLCYVYV